ncbi:hypothetical protein SAMN05660964_00513 [Thiothrix caldifontis]|uniref:Uncharacterized protein n=1 Tax=Thiothrix caldifontis TaxID=525918 RepID=A0A1H3WMR6_9GAMM|nr:hypothetical protein [Thiothrix caldifontis]SDZ88413.1 hypothetical protein SAMN05660964_00513 [Thiothrix caldifontis]
MKAKALLIFCGGLLLMQTALAEPDPVNGQKLFTHSPCDTEQLTAPNPNITDIASLEKEVRQCDISRNINWYDDEIKDVVSYLNQTYHKFQ